MGMDPFNFSDSLIAVLAQRLSRRLCEKCKQPYHPDEKAFYELVTIYDEHWFHEHNMRPYPSDFTLMKKGSCEACNGTGYKGRAAIHELLMNTETVKSLIRRKATNDEIKLTAIREGMRTLLMDGIHKIFQGITDLEELLRVCRYEASFRTDVK
jgi:type II secretory ATPase GspE/PulE/Tfp pilus assembly ATPase PilB-like protein